MCTWRLLLLAWAAPAVAASLDYTEGDETSLIQTVHSLQKRGKHAEGHSKHGKHGVHGKHGKHGSASAQHAAGQQKRDAGEHRSRRQEKRPADEGNATAHSAPGGSGLVSNGSVGGVLLPRSAEQLPSSTPVAAAAALKEGEKRVRVDESRLPGILIAVVLLLLVVALAFVLELCWSRFLLLRALSPKVQSSFPVYMRYRFQMWVSSGERSQFLLILFVCVAFIYAGTGIYCLFVGEHPGSALYKVYSMLMDPAVGFKERTAWGQAVGIMMSVGFLFILALLVAVVQEGMKGYLDSVRLGFSPVIEAKHILLVGFAEDTCALIKELCFGYAPEGGTTIVLLTEEPKDKVEAVIRQANIELLNSKVVVRSGPTNSVAHLEAVSAASCQTAILCPSRNTPWEVRDSSTLQMLLALAGKGWPNHGRILAVCTVAENMQLFRSVGGPNVDIVSLDDFVGKLMVQCSSQPGIGEVVNSIFSFDGSEFYLVPVPQQLLGLSFRDAQLYFPECLLAGVLSQEKGDGRVLAPRMDTVLTAEQQLVLFAEDVTHTCSSQEPLAVEEPVTDGSPSSAKSAATTPKAPKEGYSVEVIFVLGHNVEVLGAVLQELDARCAAGSKVVLMGQAPKEERAAWLEAFQRRLGKRFGNLSQIELHVGSTGDRQALRELPIPITEASRVFVLADSASSDAQLSDAATMTTVLMVKDHLTRSGCSEVPIVPEIREVATRQLCAELQILDLVDSSGTPAQILATIAHAPELEPVLHDLISEQGKVHLYIRKLSSYWPSQPLPASLSFAQAMRCVSAQGDVLLGWSVAPEQERPRAFHARLATLCGSVGYHWEMNPEDKLQPRAWDEANDKIVVVAPNQPREDKASWLFGRMRSTRSSA